MESNIIDQDYENIPKEYRDIYQPKEGKLECTFFHDIINSSYTGLSIRDLQTTRNNSDKTKTVYSLKKSECDRIVSSIITFETGDISVKDEYSDIYRIRLRKDFIFEAIKNIYFSFTEKRRQVLTSDILRIHYNFFDDEISKKEYFNIIGRNKNFSNYSNMINNYKCTFPIPFFFSMHKILSFPEHLTSFTPEYTLFMNDDICGILDVQQNIDGIWEDVNSSVIKDKLERRSTKFKKPHMSTCYSLLTLSEKRDSYYGCNIPDSRKVFFRNMREVNLVDVTNEFKEEYKNLEESDESSSYFKIDCETCLGIVFYSGESIISTISCFTMREGKIIKRFEDLTYEKSEAFQKISFKRQKPIEKKKFLAFTFCSDISSVDPESIVNLNNYYFKIKLTDKSTFSNLKCVSVFLDNYSIIRNESSITIV